MSENTLYLSNHELYRVQLYQIPELGCSMPFRLYVLYLDVQTSLED